MSFERLMSIAGTGMNAQLIRMNTTASNLANAGVVAGTDAGAFRAKRPVFESLLNNAMSGNKVQRITGHRSGPDAIPKSESHVTD